jgi:hypothetical protein
MAVCETPPEASDTGDLNDAAGLHGDECTHALKHGDQVDDLWLGRGVAQLRVTRSDDRPEQELLGRTHARILQFDDCAPQPAHLGRQCEASVDPLARRAERAKHFQVEIDRTFANAAPTGLPELRVTGAVEERGAQVSTGIRLRTWKYSRSRVAAVWTLRASISIWPSASCAALHPSSSTSSRTSQVSTICEMLLNDHRLLRQECRDHQLGNRVLGTTDLDRST